MKHASHCLFHGPFFSHFGSSTCRGTGSQRHCPCGPACLAPEATSGRVNAPPARRNVNDPDDARDYRMVGILLKSAATIGFLAASALSATALPLPASPLPTSRAHVIPVADGCGPGWYRGPGGACHRFGFGPYPDGYFGDYGGGGAWNGCPPGYWRGPWGHCRNTPFHGRLPDGSWQ